MSSQNFTPLVDAVSTLQTSSFFILVTVAFLVYDWLINLDQEIRCFWGVRNGWKFSSAGLLYGLSRYVPIIQAGLSAQTIFPISDTGCRINGYLILVASILYILSPATFSAIRVYALWPNNMNIALAISTFLILFVPGFAIAVINAMATLTVLPKPFNCSPAHPVISQAVATRLSVAARICYIVGDLVVLFTTWRNTFTTYRVQSRLMEGPSLMGVMLHNGSVYFIVTTTLNILDMILDQAPFGVAVNNFAAIVTDPLNAVLICHFIFDLRQADVTGTTPSSPSAVISLDFAAGSRTSYGTLPAFIAPMGSQVPGALRFVDCKDDDVLRTQSTWQGGLHDEEFLHHGDEDEDETSTAAEISVA